MMTNLNNILGLISVLALIVICYRLIVWYKLFFERRTLQNKYRLFAVRDKFVQLVAGDELKEDSWIFQTFYRSINRIVTHQHEFTLFKLLQVIKNETSPADSQEFNDKLIMELRASSTGARKAVLHFYMAMTEIIIANSIIFKTTIKFGTSAVRILKLIARYVRPRQLIKPCIDAYDVYTVSDKTCKQVASLG